jgi:hypothetical protein
MRCAFFGHFFEKNRANFGRILENLLWGGAQEGRKKRQTNFRIQSKSSDDFSRPTTIV